jgi:hypothetical protein
MSARRKRPRIGGIPARRGRPPGSSEPFSFIPSANAIYVTPQQLLVKTQRIIDALMTHEMAPPFNQPVDPIALGIPDYPKIIKNPMDLGTVRNKVYSRPCGYKYLSEFVADVRLVWNNCYTFNDMQSEISQMAKILSRAFENMMKDQMDCRIHPDAMQSITLENPGILYAEQVDQAMFGNMAQFDADRIISDEHGTVKKCCFVL